MKNRSAWGFTLIELLTVIAIIAILAGIVAVAAPRMLERAHLRQLDATMHELRNVLAQYYADNTSYPPRYGYVDFQAAQDQQAGESVPEQALFNLKPYLWFVGLHGVEDFYDNFSEGYDADRDGIISPMEYSPVGLEDRATNRISFSDTQLYRGDNPGAVTEISRMQEDPLARRPIIYIPVNLRQVKRAREYWVSNGDFYATSWEPDDDILQYVTFPPPSYDAFVLISVGPAGSTFGVVPSAPGGANAIDPDYFGVDIDAAMQRIANDYPRDMYHILGLRAYYLATRDLNDNDKLDFHYSARRTGEAKFTNYSILVGGSQLSVPNGNDLPDGRAPRGYGPYIYVYE
ncbi:MAG: type II secretion system protein [Candidatus Hydrogenedentota bacterium]